MPPSRVRIPPSPLRAPAAGMHESGYAVRPPEGWQSGRMRRSRKPLSVVRRIEGSNPSPSASLTGCRLHQRAAETRERPARLTFYSGETNSKAARVRVNREAAKWEPGCMALSSPFSRRPGRSSRPGFLHAWGNPSGRREPRPATPRRGAARRLPRRGSRPTPEACRRSSRRSAVTPGSTATPRCAPGTRGDAAPSASRSGRP